LPEPSFRGLSDYFYVSASFVDPDLDRPRHEGPIIVIRKVRVMERGHERPGLIAPKWRSEIRRNGALLGVDLADRSAQTAAVLLEEGLSSHPRRRRVPPCAP
jgi:hypothetical protein